MVARLEHFLRNTVRTYRVTLADLATSSGAATGGGFISFEITGVANKKVKLRHFQMFKPSAAIAPFRLSIYSVASTGSTGQSLISPVRVSGSSDSTFGGSVRFYTSAPLPGTLLNQGHLIDQDYTTGDVVNEHFGDEKGIAAPELNGSSESFAGFVGVAAAVTLNGYVEFTEEP